MTEITKLSAMVEASHADTYRLDVMMQRRAAYTHALVKPDGTVMGLAGSRGWLTATKRKWDRHNPSIMSGAVIVSVTQEEVRSLLIAAAETRLRESVDAESRTTRLDDDRRKIGIVTQRIVNGGLSSNGAKWAKRALEVA